MPRHSCLPLAALMIMMFPLASSAADETSSDAAREPAAPAAQAAAADDPGKAEGKAAAKPEVVCTMEAELGSRVKKKVCRARSDIDAEARDTQNALRDVRSLGNKNYNAAPGG